MLSVYECDIWSLGCVLYELCTLVPPFMDEEYSRLRQKIINYIAPDIPDRYSSDPRNMIGAMLSKEVTGYIFQSIKLSEFLFNSSSNL